MRLEDCVRKSIYEYPSLYRVVGDPRLSRLLVLEHMFCGYGTGYDWHPTGYLADCEAYKPYGKEKFPALPDGFFGYDDLLSIDLDPKRCDGLELALEGRFWYSRKDNFPGPRICVVVQATREEAKEFIRRFGFDSGLESWPHDAANDNRWRKDGKVDLSPHSMCQYSPICEMIAGHFEPIHVKAFPLDGIIRPDYIQGGIDICEELLAYYATPERYRENLSYVGQHNGVKTVREWKAKAKKQTDILKAFLKKFKGQGVATSGVA